ncbi:hypothetical protein EF879_00715 [Micromonospora sp. HM5-17]|nr:hypothetical protein EF879_00715 [Micromonospora sp. HM5-17]
MRQAAPVDLPPPSQPLYNVLNALNASSPRRTPKRIWAGIRRTRLIAIAAGVAAVTLSIGFVAVGRGGGEPTPTALENAKAVAATLVASTECADLKVAAGTVEAINGSSLVLRTESGKTITITTDGSTKVTHQVTGSVGDITSGTAVMVRGQGDESGKEVTAEQIAVLPKAVRMPNLPLEGGFLDMTRLMASRGVVMGTASAMGGDGFTVKGANGTEVKVVASSATPVVKQESTTLSELELGKYTVAVGVLTDDGTLSATIVQQDGLNNGAAPKLPENLPGGFAEKLRDRMSGEAPHDLFPNGFPKGLRGMTFSGLGCDADSIANNALFGSGMLTG